MGDTFLTLALTFADRGATCSGKTTLARFLQACLPDSIIIHQDVSLSINISLTVTYATNLTPIIRTSILFVHIQIPYEPV